MGTWVLDLDGVVWRGDELIPGADLAVERLIAAGHQVVACTNHAHAPSSKRAMLDQLGVAPFPVVTAAEAAATRCDADDRVLVLGDRSLVELLVSMGLEAIDVHDLPDGETPANVDVVVVGATHRWDRSRVGMVADAVRSGARFVATNDDPTFPTAGSLGPRLLPGNGALVAAVATAAGVQPEVAGKPFPATASLIEERYGPVDVVVGDRTDTDGGLAVALGAAFGLVLSGVTTLADAPFVPAPTWLADDLASLVAAAISLA
ncbi:MAG: HAD hydrolase-like protein [Actinomycetes bacterium]